MNPGRIARAPRDNWEEEFERYAARLLDQVSLANDEKNQNFQLSKYEKKTFKAVSSVIFENFKNNFIIIIVVIKLYLGSTSC